MNTKIDSKKYIIVNDNIFDNIKKRVTSDNNGATIFVPHVCNNVDLFGAGFAAAIADVYPQIKQDYHLLGKSYLKSRANFGKAQILKVYENPKYKHKLYFVNMIAQNGTKRYDNPRPLNYAALVRSMREISDYIQFNTGFINNQEKIEIHCPKFGSGLAGGNWEFIKDLIEDIWGRYFVTIYNPPSKKQ